MTSTSTAAAPAEVPLNVSSSALNDSLVPVPLNRFARKVPVATSVSFSVNEPNVPGVTDTYVTIDAFHVTFTCRLAISRPAA